MIRLVDDVPHARILDVGPGFGKYGLLMREYLSVKPDRLDAVEAEGRYLTEFRWLAAIYDRIHNAYVENLPDDVLAEYDLVFMGDVLEHLDERVARRLLDRIPGRVVIATPRDFFQNPEWKTHPSEKHRSAWTAADFGDRVELDASNDALAAVVVRLAPQ